MKFSVDWSDPDNPDRREIIFERRNKLYGAYVLRKNYERYVIIALVSTVIIIGLIFVLHAMLSFISNENKKEIGITEGITLDEPPPIDKNTPPPPPVDIPPPPLEHTIKFTPPLVVKDDIADDPPPTQDEIKNITVGTKNQEGADDIVDLPSDPIVSNDDDKIFTIVEEMPSFPGGDQKLFELLSRIHYPMAARENGVSGWVYMTFVVDKDGKLKDAKVVQGIGSGCDQEAIRVLMALPDWNPGRQNGRNVAVRSSLRINFTLN